MTQKETWYRKLIRDMRDPPPVVNVLRLSGVIAPRGGGLRKSIDLAGMAGPIHRAFSGKHTKAVALVVNSPGGSPVQSALIHRRIRALSEEKEIPVVAFCEDVAASGGYWLALAADEVYADANSIVGSIGVISAGFGFQDMLARIGVERRVHATGPRKGMLDPFRPEQADDVERLKALQGDMFDSFKQLVRDRRGDALTGDDEALFTGDVWTGARAAELGLIDGIADLRETFRSRYGERVRFNAVAPRSSFLKRRFGVGAADPAGDLIRSLEDRAWWARYGL